MHRHKAGLPSVHRDNHPVGPLPTAVDGSPVRVDVSSGKMYKSRRAQLHAITRAGCRCCASLQESVWKAGRPGLRWVIVMCGRQSVEFCAGS
jgi:hypothetical protein